jgi:hypothetical protein
MHPINFGARSNLMLDNVVYATVGHLDRSFFLYYLDIDSKL